MENAYLNMMAHSMTMKDLGISKISGVTPFFADR